MPYFLKSLIATRRRKLLVLVLSTLVLVVAVGLGHAHVIHAQTSGTSATANTSTNGSGPLDIVYEFLGNIIMTGIQLFATLTGVFVDILIAIAQYNTFLNAPVVAIGWPIVRDLMNMVFIVALLVIAAGTILNLQNYRYNRLLGKLIIMALLVNFSNIITVFLIQFAQVVMLTFVNAFKDIAFANFAHAFGLDQVLQLATGKTANTTWFAILISLIAGLIMMIVAFVVTLAISVVLFVRIIALWLLVILSPMAYALRILPNTENQASRWWQEFGRYVVVGPVLAFFLWLALAVVAGQSSLTSKCAANTDPVSCADPATNAAVQKFTQNNGFQSFSSNFVTGLLGIPQLMTFVVAIIFLMLGLKYAQDSGTAGSKFAGRVATSGFAAASTVTGLNYLRDRTVTPIQGWVQNRQKARQAAVQERTQKLEAFGDRVAGTYGITPGQRLRGAAASNEYERQRTAQLARRQGFKDLDASGLHDLMLNSTDHGQRQAAMQELQGRGRLNLADGATMAAFNDITQRRRAVTGAAYMPAADAQKFREEALKTSAATMTADQVRTIMPQVTRPEERAQLVQALEQKKALSAENATDVAAVNDVRAALGPLPTRLKEFDDALRKSNPDMALRTIYNGLGEGAADLAGVNSDIDRYVSDLQQGLISLNALTPQTQARLQNRLRGFGLNEEDSSSHLARRVFQGFRSEEDMDRVLGKVEDEKLNALLDGATLNYDSFAGGRLTEHRLDSEQQKWLADHGYVGEAFTVNSRVRGRYTDEAGVDQYSQLQAEKVKENYEKGKLSNGTLANQGLLNQLDRLGAVDDDAVSKLTRSDRKRQLYMRSKAASIDTLRAAGADFGTDTEEGLQNRQQEIFAGVASRGGNFQDAAGVDRSVISLFDPTTISAAARAANPRIIDQLTSVYEQFIRTQGDRLTRLKFADVNRTMPHMAESIVNNITVRDLAAIHDDNTQSVVDIINEMKRVFSGMPTTDPRYDRLERFLNSVNGRIRNNDILSGYL